MTVLDEAGAVVDRWAFHHTEQDLAGALDRLAGLSEPAALPVITERTSGLVVERLVAAGHPVVPVHPTAFWAAGPRWGASEAKSDAGDSDKVADYLRTDGHRLRRLDRSDPGLRELQALVRLREDHLRARTAASMKLGALLEAHWPGPKAVFYRLASPIALAFLPDSPTPQAAAHLGEARMASLLPPTQLPRRQASGGAAGPAAVGPTASVGIPAATLATLVRAQVQQLRTLLGTIAELEAVIAKRVACHPRAKLLASLPGVGTINLAQLLAEVGPILDRVDSAEQAAAECGAAPVTKASAKPSGVYFRWAANRRARKALTGFAHNSRLASPWAGACTPTLGPAASATPRHPHRRPWLASGHLGLLAASHPLQSRPAHRRASSCSSPNLTQGTETAAVRCRLPMPAGRPAPPAEPGRVEADLSGQRGRRMRFRPRRQHQCAWVPIAAASRLGKPLAASQRANCSGVRTPSRNTAV